MSQQHTYNNDPAAEQLIDTSLAAIARDVAADPILSSNLQAVVLGGGYGRGEGGVTPDHKLYNDMDFFVFPKHYSSNELLKLQLHHLSVKWEQKLHIDVDFFLAPNANYLERNKYTLMIQELLAGHQVIYGDEHFLDHAPRLFWDELPWREGARLLLNRGSGLLLARRAINKPREQNFVNRNIHKAMLGCGDAILLAHGEYKQHGIERMHILAMQPDLPPKLLEEYQKSLKFKYTPQLDAPEISPEQLNQAIGLYLECVNSFCRAVTGIQCKSVEESLKKLLHFTPGYRDQSLKNIILTLKYAPVMHRINPVYEHPRLKLLLLLVDVLKNADSPNENRYLKIWEKLN